MLVYLTIMVDTVVSSVKTMMSLQGYRCISSSWFLEPPVRSREPNFQERLMANPRKTVYTLPVRYQKLTGERLFTQRC